MVEWRSQISSCFGAADGKDVGIIHLEDTGPEHFIYKDFYSIYIYLLWSLVFACWGRNGRQAVYVMEVWSETQKNILSPAPPQ